MNLTESIIIGTIQGLTEFLPVSSSAHLVFIQKLLGWNEPELFFDIILHCGTLFSVIIFFYKDIIKLFKDIRTIILLLVATIPTGLIGILMSDYIDKYFASEIYPAIFLLITGLLLYLTKYVPKNTKQISNFSISDVVLVGIAQGISVLPGISRSGSTLSTGILLGWDRADTIKFIFLLSIPSISGATILKFRSISISDININCYVIGFIIAFITGLLSIKILVKCIQNMKLHFFSYYCWLLGISVIIISIIKYFK